MNIVLEQIEEFEGGKLTNKYGEAFIRGNNVLYISAKNIKRGADQEPMRPSRKSSQYSYGFKRLFPQKANYPVCCRRSFIEYLHMHRELSHFDLIYTKTQL
eukprot:TRINITY_DN4240_c0_g1_i5.p3 TRINITY_DN4240_c0_g1~~TRINITY_DN4240_c0_g1_i5.p3  ORF type:complete len:101 (-),score=5.10 TRINITY_DN4240_c0_g1_i5:136-438(-)